MEEQRDGYFGVVVKDHFVTCQVVGEPKTHGGRTASWIAQFMGSFMRIILCERHARGFRVVGIQIREEN